MRNNQVSNHQRIFLIAGLLIVALNTLYFHAMYYYPFISDDSLISLRYANRLLNGEGLTWTDGKPVEGYSNLLWVLLVAAMGLLGVDLIDASRLLGFIGMMVVVFSILNWHVYKNKAQSEFFSVATSLFFFCMAAPIAVWTIGGLEQPLYAALISLLIPITVQIIESDTIQTKEIFFLSLVLGLISITRPDGPLFSIAIFLSIYIGRFSSNRKNISISGTLFLALFPLLFYGGQILFRVHYYGEIVPNTALVKIAPSTHHFKSGVIYIGLGMWALFPFSLLAIVSIIISLFSPSKRSIGITLLIILILWIPYLAFIGGDIFPAHRHFVPVIVVFAFALVEGVNWLFKKPWNSKVIYVVTMTIFCAAFLGIQFTLSSNERAITERWEWDGKVIGLTLKEAFSEKQPLIAVTAAGCIPYWSELPALDMFGLNDYYLPRNPPEDFGSGILGHELGDGNYVLRQEPDIIIFHTGIRNAVFRSGREMQQTKEFYKLYTPIKIKGSFPYNYEATLWFRKHSPKIGIKRTSSKIEIPGFFFNENQNTVAYANDAGKLVVAINSSQSASTSIDLDSKTSQNWKVLIKASNEKDLHYKLKQEGTSLIIVLSTKSSDYIEIEEVVLLKNEMISEQIRLDRESEANHDLNRLL